MIRIVEPEKITTQITTHTKKGVSPYELTPWIFWLPSTDSNRGLSG